MTGAYQRLAAIVRADFLIRFRRPSTAVVFLLLSALAYVWIPDPASGRALFVLQGQRAILNSATIGMASALLASISIGLGGFYVVSNALRTDITTRCGFVIAATPVGRLEYVVGKFFGNLLFLLVFTAGFMLTSMGMVVVRGEAGLEPAVIAAQYLVLVPPSLAFVAAVAVLFESIPLLSGRLGDVLYFFVWVVTLSVVPVISVQHLSSTGLLGLFDFSGMGYLIDQLGRTLHTDNIAIGASEFDPAKGTFVFNGLPVTPAVLAVRLGATLLPMVLLAPAALFFHRFDPARVRVGTAKGGTGWLAQLSRLLKPITRAVYAVPAPGAAVPALLRAAIEDARLTLASLPLVVVAMLGLAVASLLVPLPALRTGLLPGALVLAALAVADIGCRERSAGLTALLYSAPGIRAQFVFWKALTALLVLLTLFAVPLGRLLISQPDAVLPLLAGLVFVAALATLLAVVSGTPKTFLILFLSFWYASLNARGRQPALDFAGLYDGATAATVAGYLTVSVLALLGAHLWHRRQLRAQW